jgi:acetamidase/formamidase
MDCPDVRPGNTLMFPVSRPGALFKLGDVHAVQGDGEICGVAIEVDSVVTLRFGLRKGWTIGWPRIESSDEIMTVGSARPLEDAARQAFREMVDWMASDHGWEKDDAYMFLSGEGPNSSNRGSPIHSSGEVTEEVCRRRMNWRRRRHPGFAQNAVAQW